MLPGAAAQAQAQDCTLKEIVSLPITKVPNEDHTGFFYTVPVTVHGDPVQMALEPTFPGTAIDQAMVDKQHLYTQRLAGGIRAGLMGQGTGAQVLLSDLRVGPAQDRDAAATVLPKPLAPGVDGVLGEDVLSHFDLELNLRAGWAKLFFQDHCPGQVVYWGRPYTVVALHEGSLGQKQFEVRLNGTTLVAVPVLVFGSDHMASDDVRAKFDLRPGSPGVIEHPTEDGKSHYYSYPFGTLSLNGYLLPHPSVRIFPRDPSYGCRIYRGCYGDDQQLYLGVDDLGRMRLYFAYREGKLYVTDPDPEPAAAPPSQPSGVK